MRGIQLRERGLIFGNVRLEWRQINRFTWPNDNKLVIYLTSRTMVPIPIPAGARKTIDQVLRMKTARTMKPESEPTSEPAAPRPFSGCNIEPPFGAS
jgi:hypothetical protein